MQQISSVEIAEIKARIDRIQQRLASGAAAQPTTDRRATTAVDPLDGHNAALIDRIAFSIEMRRVRKSHFGRARLSGPTWDMMLDLMLAQASGRELSASDLATGADVPLSSGLRMIAQLERFQLAERFTDTRDRRRSIVRLTGHGSASMASYFAQIDRAWHGRHRRAM